MLGRKPSPETLSTPLDLGHPVLVLCAGNVSRLRRSLRRSALFIYACAYFNLPLTNITHLPFFQIYD